VEKFKKNKVSWIKKSGILKNKSLIKKIPQQSQKILSNIVSEIMAKQDEIMHEISQKILDGDYGEILLTVKIGSKYLQDIEGFENILRVAAQGEDFSSTIEDVSIKNSNCIICGKVGTRDLLKESNRLYNIMIKTIEFKDNR
ncbi:MAG: TM1802 family CRISPR-associated protein, partial [Thermoproteota archaeon]|nr:TM1802 family CRISPR-associated protein [Thermoproteota archaeon]